MGTGEHRGTQKLVKIRLFFSSLIGVLPMYKELKLLNPEQLPAIVPVLFFIQGYLKGLGF